MRYISVLPLVTAVVTALVIPNDESAKQLRLELVTPAKETTTDWWHALRLSAEQTVEAVTKGTHKLIDELSEVDLLDSLLAPGNPDAILGIGRPGDSHHGHNLTENLTVYEAIQLSNHSRRFAALVNDFPDVVKLLNTTDSKITAFVPTDEAFDKIPKDHPKPPRELMEEILEYHILHGVYPAKRLFSSHTVPTALKADELGGRPQRLRISVSLFGLRINVYSKVVLGNLYTKNGVVHAVDSILVPPPPARRVISLFPAKFSTLELAAEKTGLLPHRDEPGKAEEGSEPDCEMTGLTVFAPTNFAFAKLGPGANAFLFNTKKGLGYLRALLKYHIVVNQTLYSDAFYGPQDQAESLPDGLDIQDEADRKRGRYHITLPTLLEDKSLSIDIAYWYRLINIRINGYTNVFIEDGIAKDGVVQVLNSVLIPPHGPRRGKWVEADGEISVEDLVKRLDPYVDEEDRVADGDDDETAGEL